MELQEKLLFSIRVAELVPGKPTLLGAMLATVGVKPA